MIISSLWTAGNLGDNNLTINPPDGFRRAGFSMCSKQQKPYVELSTNRPVIVHAYGMLTIYRFVIAKPCKRLWQSVPFVIAREQCDRGNLFSPKGYLRILSRYALRMTDHLVIAVRVSGGHLCEAEAPTEPAGETAARCAAIRSLFFHNNEEYRSFQFGLNDAINSFFHFLLCDLICFSREIAE